jgi:hypothetical protein
MDVPGRLADLPGMHPNLLWDTMIPTTVAVLTDCGTAAPHLHSLTVPERARPVFEELLQSHPGQAEAIRQVIEELERDYPARS